MQLMRRLSGRVSSAASGGRSPVSEARVLSEAASAEGAASSDVAVDVEVFHKLEELVCGPGFLQAIQHAQTQAREQRGELGVELRDVAMGASSAAVDTAGSQAASPEESSSGEDVAPPSSSDPCTDAAAASTSGGDSDPAFVVINKDDCIEAMAYYLAQTLAKHPEAQTMPPERLQEALSLAMKGLRQSRFKQLCSYGRHVYRWTALTYSALQMYQNPWLIQAILTTVWTMARLAPTAARLIW